LIVEIYIIIHLENLCGVDYWWQRNPLSYWWQWDCSCCAPLQQY